MFKIRAKSLKESGLTQKQERQLELELKFADEKRNFVSRTSAEVFVSNLPAYAQAVVEIVPHVPAPPRG